MRWILLALLAGGVAWQAIESSDKGRAQVVLGPPMKLMAEGKPIRVESPGFACPSWADLDGDGKPELLVGQFRAGKIKVYSHLEGVQFAPGKWLQADGKEAEVPGVW
jgi:hypothetical protein